MFAAVNEVNKTVSSLSESLSNVIFKLLVGVEKLYNLLTKQDDLEECARLLQKTEYKHESVDYVYLLLKNKQ